MGLCQSCGCGESHPKPPLLPFSTRHRRSSASPSLTTFLHLWTTETTETTETTDTTDNTSETTNKLSRSYPLFETPPQDDDYSHLAIPHSSELFSLPSSDAGSIARSSTSSTSLSWSTENPKTNLEQSTHQPTQPRGSNVARRKSCSSLGQQELLPEHWHKKSLADTIARLEKFCDVKLFLENRINSQSWTVVPHSKSDCNGSTILVQESCRDFAQKLLWFANDHAGGMFTRCAGDAKREVVVTNEQTELSETVSAGERTFRRDADQFQETVPEVANLLSDHPENLESNEPVVASFRRDAENCQSKLDAGETTLVMGKLPSLRFYDEEENIQFTDFEATFELLAAEMSALHCSAEADQASRTSISTENVAPGLGVCQSVLRESWTRSGLGGGRQVKKGPKNPTLFRSTLSGISSYGTPADEPLGWKNLQPLKSQTSTRVLKRGGSRSLDLQYSALSHNPLKSERWQLSQGAAETVSRGESQRIESGESRRIEVADSATIEQLAGEEGRAPSPSGDSALSHSQTTKGGVSVCGGGGEERFSESVCTDDANGGDETPYIHDNPEFKSLSQAIDKLPEIPPRDLASGDTSELPEATTETLEFSADGAQTATEAAAECRPLRYCENENWHEAPAPLDNTVQPELPTLHNADCLPETLPGSLSVDVLIDPTQQFSNMKACT